MPGTPLSRRTVLRLGLGMTVLGAGCAPVQPSESKGGAKTFTIYWNAGHGYDAYKQVIDRFGKEHDLQMNWQKFQWPDLNTKLVADFRSGNVPDLVEEVGAGTGTQYGIAGNVLALDTFAAGDAEMKFPGDFIDAAVTARRYDGKTYSVPLHLTANGLFLYNKQLLADAGFDRPPTTWEEYLEVAKATTKGDVKGTAPNSDQGYSAPFYYQQGVDYSDVRAKAFLVPDDKATLSLQFMQDLIFRHKVSPAPVATTDYSGPQKLFSAKRAATFITGPWDLDPVRKGSPDVELGVAPPLKGSVQASALAGSGLMIPAKAKDPELSWKLLRELTALRTELAATKEVGMSMPRKSWAQDAGVAADPTLKTIAAALRVIAEQDPQLPATGKAAQIGDLYKKAYQQIVIQQRPVTQSLNDFREQAKAAIG